MREREGTIDYQGDFEEIFNQVVDRPQFFETGEGYCGKLNKNEFWIYRKHPFITNSFRTVLYGMILNDHQICYKYGKLKGVRAFVFLADLVFLAFLIYGIVNQIINGNYIVPMIVYFMPVMICAVLTALACICFKAEKEDLYQVLKRICSINYTQ